MGVCRSTPLASPPGRWPLARAPSLPLEPPPPTLRKLPLMLTPSIPLCPPAVRPGDVVLLFAEEDLDDARSALNSSRLRPVMETSTQCCCGGVVYLPDWSCSLEMVTNELAVRDYLMRGGSPNGVAHFHSFNAVDQRSWEERLYGRMTVTQWAVVHDAPIGVLRVLASHGAGFFAVKTCLGFSAYDIAKDCRNVEALEFMVRIRELRKTFVFLCAVSHFQRRNVWSLLPMDLMQMVAFMICGPTLHLKLPCSLPALDFLNCPLRHGLRRYEIVTTSCRCDTCFRGMKPGEIAYECRVCNYDVCETCRNSQGSFLEYGTAAATCRNNEVDLLEQGPAVASAL